MRIAVITTVGSYTEADRRQRAERMAAQLRPGSSVALFTADSGVPNVERGYELALTEVAVCRKAVDLAGQGFDAIVGTAFLDNGLDAARELVDIPVVGPAQTTLYLAATLANRFGIIMAGGDLGELFQWFCFERSAERSKRAHVPEVMCRVVLLWLGGVVVAALIGVP